MTSKTRSSIPVVQVSDDVKEVACDGGEGILGHPLVYLPFGSKQIIVCYYCGKQFEKK